MEKSRLETLRDIFRPRIVRVWALLVAALFLYDVLCNQFDLPKLPKLWGMSGSLLPWWGWLMFLQLGFTYALFEYVHRSSQLLPQAIGGVRSPPDREKEWDQLCSRINGMAASIGAALASKGPLAYRSAVAQAEGVLLPLAKSNGFDIPELRGDGEEVGCMRALIYITDLSPLLGLDDQDAARKRAAVLTKWLNGLFENELERLVKLEDVGPF